MSGLRVLVAGESGPALDAFTTALAAALRQRGRDAMLLQSSPDRLASDPMSTPAGTICLLMGLEPPMADPKEAGQAHADWRAALKAAHLPFRVIYGNALERLDHALRAIDASLLERPARTTNWVWSCEKCSDAQCEHQLFRQLVSPTAP